MFEAIRWPAEMAPSRSPIHLTNELEVAASSRRIWSLLIDTTTWPRFYPGVEHVQLLDGPTSLRSGTRFETNLAGQGDRSHNNEFFSEDLMIRHEPGVRDGVGEFLRDVTVLMKHRTIDEKRS